MASTTVLLDEILAVAEGVGDAPDNGPVFVIRPGKSPLVLLTAEEYRRLSGKSVSILDLLAYPGVGEIDFEPPRLDGVWHHDVDLSD